MERQIDIMLSQLNKETQSDKGTYHDYLNLYYENAFRTYKDKKITLLEIGVNYGSSLELWSKYFSNAEIIGVDYIDYGYKPTKENIKTIIGNATKKETFNQINQLDIVIDDGSHNINHQLASFKILYEKLTNNGLYIIEDIKNIDQTKNDFKNLSQTHGVKVEIFDFRNLKNIKDSVIVEIKK